MTEGTPNPAPNPGEGGETKPAEGKTFTQAELDQLITERLAQQAKNKFGDYAELKAKAEGAKTVEQKLADLEAKHAEAEARTLRSDIALKYGISAEDRDLFLTGSDAAALEAQAKRLAERAVDQKKNGNRAPKEGGTTTDAGTDKDLRDFTRTLFASAQTD
ncbi:hypothetical protein ACTJJ4_11600 [Microbacterium sp. 22195]|uniref:hypothetical protein n=1 Tax=Microbacterium sp. 22195 TaxID=3453891 RepID=UPI003F86A2A9